MEERHTAEVALENRDTLLFESARTVEKNLELLGTVNMHPTWYLKKELELSV